MRVCVLACFAREREIVFFLLRVDARQPDCNLFFPAWGKTGSLSLSLNASRYMEGGKKGAGEFFGNLFTRRGNGDGDGDEHAMTIDLKIAGGMSTPWCVRSKRL